MHFGMYRVYKCVFVCPGSSHSQILTENCTPIFTLYLAPSSVEPGSALISECFWVLQSKMFIWFFLLEIVIIRFQLFVLFCILSAHPYAFRIHHLSYCG